MPRRNHREGFSAARQAHWALARHAVKAGARQLFPTLPTLLRIAMVFSVGLDYFFTDERKRHVVAIVRKHDRIRFPERPSGEVSYWFESLDFAANERRLSAFLAEFQPVAADKQRLHQHAGVEFL